MTRLVAAFESPEALVKCADRLKAEGAPAEDALTPFRVHGIEEALGLKQSQIRRIMAVAGFTMAAFAWFLQWFSLSVAYPFISGDRPYNSWQVFPLVVFEASVLTAGIAGFIALLYSCGLPALYHPVLDVPGIERATSDRFFLIVPLADATAGERLRYLLAEEGALHIEEAGA